MSDTFGSGGEAGFSSVILDGSGIGTSLMQILMADDIQPGSDPSYELCKLLFTHHPLGPRMAKGPVDVAQSQEREITVQGAPDEVVAKFRKTWNAVDADTHINNAETLARVYGIAAVVLGVVGKASDQSLDMTKLSEMDIFFNVLDPLNTAGSLVMSQQPNSAAFNRSTEVRVQGDIYHRSRTCVVMNEEPVYLAYTSASFGYTGRSVYQRVLYPMKSFVRTMISNEMIATKLGLIVAKQQSPGSIVDNVMKMIAGVKRGLLKWGQTGNVLSIGLEESIETLNMANVDGAGTFARTNILQDIATGADMPAVMLRNETLAEGFADGSEDAKIIARWIERMRTHMGPVYAWFDKIVQYRAWDADFVELMRTKYPEIIGSRSYDDVFREWVDKFAAAWPSLLIEPESEKIKVAETKLKAIIAAIEVLLPTLDPENRALLIQWAADNFNGEKTLFEQELALDVDALRDFLSEQKDLENEVQQAQLQEPKPNGPFSARDSAVMTRSRGRKLNGKSHAGLLSRPQ